MQENVTLKGKDDKLEIHFAELASYMTLREELLSKLDENKSFFQKANVKIVISGRTLSEAQRKEIKRIFLMDYDIKSVYFSEEQGEMKKTPVVYESKAVNSSEAFSDLSKESFGLVSNAYFDAQSIFISHTVRSGQRIECEGDIIVIGDVNPGAELIAGGSIAVFGKLRGLAHAGASGREDVCVAALYMEPKQIRVSGHVVITEERKNTVIGEVAELKKGTVVIRPINDKF